MKRNNKKGFTIVELVIVIAVIAILSAVLIPTFGGIIEKAQASADVQEARNAYTEYITDMEDYTNGLPTFDYVKQNGKFYNVDDEFKVVTVNGDVFYLDAATGTVLHTLDCADVETDADHKCDKCGAKVGECNWVDVLGAEGSNEPDGKCDTCGK